MSDRFAETLIRHCAATLAGHKAGSLFCWRGQEERLSARVSTLQAELAPKGVRILLLCRCDLARQVYVFRPAMLRALLDQPDNAAFLRGLGYRRLHDLEAALCQLSRRFQDPACFPHELGLFLGYPLEDVQGFIQNDGKNYLFKGFWKVYAKEEASRERFALYMKCREIYLRCYYQGKSVSRLTVAA